MKNHRVINLQVFATRAFTAFTLALTLSGCAIQTPTPENSLNQDADSDNGQQITPDQPVPENEQVQPELDPCSQVEQSGIEKTINAQTASFAVGDFELAYSYASDSFQASVSLESFISIIQGSYGPLISSSTLSFSNCLVTQDADLATIVARFSEAGTELYALRYVLTEVDSQWRVDGASGLESVGSGA